MPIGSLEQKYYEWEGFWEEEQYTSGETAKRIAATVALVPAGVRTLVDVGCGNGEFGRQLGRVRPEIRIRSIDRSSAALKKVTTEKSIGSVESIPLETRSMDVVSCLQVLEHLPVPIYQRGLGELARVADRYLLVSVPFEENLANGNTTCPTCGSVFNADLHLRSYNLEQVSSLFARQNFYLVDRRHVGLRLETLGMQTYERIRNVFAPRPRGFAAPSCPICGYEREPNGPAAAGMDPQSSPLRRTIQAMKFAVVQRLPKRRLADYWIIALYQRKT